MLNPTEPVTYTFATFNWFVDNVLKEVTQTGDGWDYNGTGACGSLHTVSVLVTTPCGNLTGCNVKSACYTYTVNCGTGGAALVATPNPAQSQLSIEFITTEDGKMKIAANVNFFSILLNSSFEQMKTAISSNSKANIDVSDLPDGLYFLIVDNGFQKETRRIQIKK